MKLDIGFDKFYKLVKGLDNTYNCNILKNLLVVNNVILRE